MKCASPRVFRLNNNAISGQAIWLKRIIGADISRIQLELVSVPLPSPTLVQLRVRKKSSHPPRPLISLLSVILQEIDPPQRVAKIRPSNFRLALPPAESLENRLEIPRVEIERKSLYPPSISLSRKIPPPPLPPFQSTSLKHFLILDLGRLSRFPV